MRIAFRKRVLRLVFFAMLQLAGYIVPFFNTIQTAPIPVDIGIALLFPGSVIALSVLPERATGLLAWVLILGVNLSIWLLFVEVRLRGIRNLLK